MARRSSSHRKPKRRARDIEKLVELSAASLANGHDAMLSARRAAEALDALQQLKRAPHNDYADELYSLLLAAMRSPGADSGYALAVRAIGTFDALRKDYGGDADPDEFQRTLPVGVYYAPRGAGYPYQARVWDKSKKKLVSLGRFPTPEQAASRVAKYRGRNESSTSQAVLDNQP
jgi:hypothetical protein